LIPLRLELADLQLEDWQRAVILKLSPHELAQRVKAGEDLMEGLLEHVGRVNALYAQQIEEHVVADVER